MAEDKAERRGFQRIVTNQVGRSRFWLSWYGGRVPLEDLSIEGFAISRSTPPASEQPFEFLIEREDSVGGINGQAQIVTFSADVRGGTAGCRFVELHEDAQHQLTTWLAGHVYDVAAVRVTRDDAEDIVLGPSIV